MEKLISKKKNEIKKFFVILFFVILPFFAFSQIQLISHDATKIYPDDTRITYLQLNNFCVDDDFLEFVENEILSNTLILRFNLDKDGETCFFHSHKDITEYMVVDAINDAIDLYFNPDTNKINPKDFKTLNLNKLENIASSDSYNAFDPLTPVDNYAANNNTSSRGTITGSSDCENALPFCASNTNPGVTFSIKSETVSAPPGQCSYMRSPTWWYMQISDAGDLDMTIASSCGDVDFACYGPFDNLTCDPADLTNLPNSDYFSGSTLAEYHSTYNPTSATTSNSTAVPFCTTGALASPSGNLVDFGGSTAAIEYLQLRNAQVGEIYIVLIGNYARCAGNVTFEQTNIGQPGAGSIDCNIVGSCNVSNVTANTVCSGTTYTVSGNIVFTNPPSDGVLMICDGDNCQTFYPPFTSPTAYSLSGLTVDGLQHQLVASFVSSTVNCERINKHWAPIANTISLTSDIETISQSVCSGTPITNITYTSTGATGAMFSGLPTGVSGSYSGGEILISGTATTTEETTYNYTVTLTGGCGFATATGSITITPFTDPTFIQNGPFCSGELILDLPTTSNNGITGTWSPTINNLVTTTYTFTPSSGVCISNSTMEIVINPFPSVTCPVDYDAVSCNDAIPNGATTPAEYIALGGITNATSVSYVDDLPNTSGCIETTTRTYTLSLLGCSSSCTHNLTRTMDSAPPVITGTPADISYDCSGDVPAADIASVTATDNCAGVVDVVVNDVITAGTCANNYTITRTWTATDICGNSSTSSQTIIIDDIIAPVISGTPADATYECSEEVPVADIASVTASDNCVGIVDVSVNDVITAGTCDHNYIITRTWTATDVCGNSSSSVQVITVDDDIAPIILGTPADILYTCSEEVPMADIATVTATDNCAGTINLTVNDVVTPGTCINNYTITRTWTATDVCGNSSASVQVITVDDNIAPIILGTPADILYTCSEEVPVADIASVSATDNCAGAVDVVVNDVVVSGTCGHNYTITRTWTATDVCGNSSTSTQIITVDDNIAPVITGTPADVTFACSEEVPVADIASVSASDNCAGVVDVVVNDVITAGTCANNYIITRTWTATDVCGNSSTSSQIITVDDNIAPVITGTPADVTFACSEEVPVADIASVSASDNCAGVVDVVVNDVITAGTCANNYTITRTWTATDICGNSSTSSQTIIIDDIIAPVISGTPADATYECSEEVPVADIASVTASDNCVGIVDVSVNDVITAGTCDHNYIITRTWTATDVCGNSSSSVQVITVDDDIAPIILGTPADILYTCSEEVPMADIATVTATDNCAGTINLTVNDVVTPGTCINNYTITRTWTATDVCGNSSASVQVITVDDNIAPIILGTPADILYTCSEEVPVADIASVSATDNCAGAVDVVVNDVVVSGTCGHNYTITRTWTATDVCGNSSTSTQIITVDDNIAPVITGTPADVTFACSEEVPVADIASVSASDNCAGVVDVVVNDVITAGTCANNYIITRTWTATDVCGNSSTSSQTIIIDDIIAPVISGTPADVTFECSGDVPVADIASVTATDNCVGIVDVSVNDVVTNQICDHNYIITRTWTATDVCGNSSSSVQIITVDDIIAPVITGTPVDVTYECSEEVPVADIASVNATDNCAGIVEVTVEDLITAGTCDHNYTITRTWTATDICGNSSSSVQIITVDDNIAPVITGTPADVTFECSGDVPVADIASVSASDNCAGVVDVVVNDVITAGTCANNYIITRTWTATDVCGNSSTSSQTIIIDDIIAPVISGTPADVTFECSGDVPVADIASVSASDNCAGVLDVVVNDVITAGTCANNYTITRTWTATDICGNNSSSVQIITVDDNIAPVITGTPADVTFACSEEVPMAVATTVTATDNCAGTINLTVNDVVTPGTCINNYTITRTWTATDVCGNSSASVQVITVDDNIAPIILGTPADILYTCSEEVPVADIASVSASDNCVGIVDVSVNDVITAGTCANNYTITRTWTATDICGNSSTSSQTIIIDDIIAPVISGTPADATYECSEEVPVADIASVTASDNCVGIVDVSVNDVITAGTCDHNYIITRTWTATDVCGNSSSSVQVITVDDDIAPIILGTPADILYTCSEEVPMADIATVTATDNCAGTINLTVNDVVTPGTCINNYTITRTWTATDVCGNSSASVQVITVDDNIAPIILGTPADILYTCSEEVPVADIASVSATDNCAGAVDVVVNDVVVSGTCGHNYTITRTWTATDVCGNSSTSTQIITVDDNIAPVITGTPADVTFACSEEVPVADIASVSASDNCAGVVDVVVNDVITAGTCANNYIITRTWTATDVCGNSSTSSQTIIIDDIIAPVISGTPADVTFECSGDVPVADIASVTATDNCVGIVDVSVNDVVTNQICDHNYIITRTWTATDVCGNSSSSVQIITVDDNIAPVISGTPADILYTCSEEVPVADIASVTATDNCIGAVTITVNDIASGQTCDLNYTITRTWNATDVCGNSSTSVQVITVDDNIAPTITGTPVDVLYTCSEEVPVADIATVTATDNCIGVVELAVSDVVTAGTCVNNYTITRTWTATDVCGNSSTSTQIITVDDNIAPIILGTPADVLYTCSEEVPMAVATTVTATDNCAGTINLTVNDVVTPGTCINNYTITRTWTATDVCGNSSSSTQIITVDDNIAPIILGTPADVLYTCSEEVPMAVATTVTATDNCAGTINLTVNDVVTPGTCINNYTITRTWTATDVCGNSSTSVQIITVDDNIAPTITGTPADITYDCSGDVPVADIASVTATDNCAGAVDVVVNDVVVSGTCGHNYTITRTWTATDVCGNSSTSTQIITVDDNIAPIILGTPADILYACSEEVPMAVATTVTATDNCAGTINLTVNDVVTPGTCINNYTITRTWTATDVCGNSSASVQVITVDDNIAPIILGTPADILYTCSEEVPVADIVTATDNCTGTINLTVNDVVTPGTCGHNYTITRTWTATDVCGNSSTSVQVITVDDDIAPIILGTPADILYACSEEVPMAVATTVTATDNCAGTINLTVNDVVTPGTCINNYTITRTWTATDVCGNSSTSVQIITVDDNIAPTITGTPADITYDCSGDVPVADIASVTATDNCAGAVDVVVNDVVVSGTCGHNYTITRTWTATDVCGNNSSSVQIITVDDNIAPVITGTPADVTFACSEEVPMAVATTVTASDNCAGVLDVVVNDVITAGTCADNYTITRTWTATDICGNSSSSVQIITVDDIIAPVITGTPVDVTYECSEEVPVADIASVNATDNCAGIVEVTVEDLITAGTCDHNYTITRTWTATDVCGNNSSSVQIITVDDNIAPVITGTPADVTFACSEEVPVADIASVSASDNCAGVVDVVVNDVITAGTCANNYTITRTWTATDICGNNSSSVQIITVDDNIAPVITSTPADVTFECSGEVPVADIASVTATDNCVGIVEVTVEDLITAGTCANNYTITRTWTATDICGNSSTSVQIITVDDIIAPVIINCPDSQMFCSVNSGMYNIPTISVSDNCIGEIETTFNISGATNRTGIGSDASGVFEIGTSTIFWTVTDACNNESTCSVIVTIDETLLPTFDPFGPFCIGSSPSLLPAISLNGVNGTWIPDVINTESAGSMEYIFTPDTAQCAIEASINIEIIEITLEVTTSNPLCFDGEGSIGFTANGSNDYSYFVNDSVATSPHIVTAGTYSVVVSDGICSTSQNVTLIQPDLLETSFIKSDVNCNGENNGDIDLTVEGGTTPYSFEWSDGSLTTEDRTGLFAGTYSVIVTDANGCSASIDSIAIIQPSEVSILGVISHVSCADGNNGVIVTTISGGNDGGYSYLWSSSQQTANIDDVIAGTYSITATDSLGCEGTASFEINQPEEINISSQISHPTCHDFTNGEIILTVSGGSPSYSYLWNLDGNGNSETQNLNDVGVGTYSVIVTDSLLCTSEATYTLTEPSILSVSETVVNTTCDLPNGSVGIIVSGGTPQYTYQWDAAAQNATTPAVTNLTNQEYSVTVTDANQCIIIDTITVGRDTPPTLSLVEQINETCSDSNAEITVEVSGGRPDYTFTWNANQELNSHTISNISAGNYEVIVADADACTHSLTILIENYEAHQVGIASISPAHCDQSDGEAILEVVGGSGNYTFDWGTSPPRPSIHETNLPGGEYTVTVNDGVCDVEVIIDIPNLPGPTVNASANPTETYISKSLIRFNDGSIGATSWYWDYGVGQYSQEQTPSFKYEVPGTYNVVLTVNDDYGCSASDTIKVIIHEGLQVWIPDAFSPNGDGLNDLFGPVASGMSLDGYEMVILDRWGKQAFYTNDYFHRWDGTINGQRVQVNSIYLYKIIIKDILGKKHKYFGRVSLVY